MTDQCCGACRWWKQRLNPIFGDCEFPIPKLPDSYVAEDMYRDYMNTSEGVRCPCFAPRDEQIATPIGGQADWR